VKGQVLMCQEREMGHMGWLKAWAGPFITPASFFSSLFFSFFLNPTSLSCCFVYWLGIALPYAFVALGPV